MIEMMMEQHIVNNDVLQYLLEVSFDMKMKPSTYSFSF
jgi:hypothetical protein